jgi:hypothetical protein
MNNRYPTNKKHLFNISPFTIHHDPFTLDSTLTLVIIKI